jgi:hypothetical protein
MCSRRLPEITRNLGKTYEDAGHAYQRAEEANARSFKGIAGKA